MKIFLVLNTFLLFALCLYTGQSSFAIGCIIQYLCGYFLFYICFRPKHFITWDVYNLFFFIYGLLVVVSHIELIHDPLEDFYVHNDASDAFYPAIVDYVLPCTWMEIPEKSLLNPFFVNYPLPAFLFGIVAKIGTVLGIENLRLFLRFHSVVIGSLTMSVMTNLLVVYKYNNKFIIRYLVPFGLCSYLFITSAVFTRDVHACLAYATAVYICLKPNIRYRPLCFFLVFLLSIGIRPANGLLMLIFPFAFYYDFLKKKVGALGISIIMAVALLIVLIIMSETISEVTEALDHYDDLTNENTGGLFMKFYSLPFPINTIIIVIYMLMLPLPIDGYIVGNHGTLMNLPFVLSPYIMVVVVCVCGYIVIKAKVRAVIKYTIIASMLAFAITVYGSPDLRRAFCAIPGLYMCYCLTEHQCPYKVKKTMKRVGWSLVFFVSVALTLFVRFRG